MELKVLGSCSKGNCYLLVTENETLILELGVPFKEVLEALDFNLTNVVGCLVSHLHKDHSKGIDHATISGLNVYSLEHTFHSYITNHRHKFILPNQAFKLGNFKILPFEVKHDVPTLGFLINHPESGNVLFITDTFYVPNTFKNLNHILLEVNHSRELMAKRLVQDELNMFLRNRTIQSHMSLETATDMLRANDLSKVQNIVLIHLSDGNSDAKHFQSHIQGLTGKNTVIAEKGLVMDLSINSF